MLEMLGVVLGWKGKTDQLFSVNCKLLNILFLRVSLSSLNNSWERWWYCSEMSVIQLKSM